uniref:Cytochrome P450 n=1 Tax=Oryza meridionalis TaxID=40149 RepID=A0A0E0C3C5_9ORYZ
MEQAAGLVYQLFQHEMFPWTFSVLALFPFLLLVLHYLATNLTTPTTWKETRNHHPPPPSPPRLPIIGHLHLIGDLLHVSLRELAHWYGPDLMLLHLGQVPNLIVSSPRAAEAVLRTHDLVFASRPYSLIADILLYSLSDVGLSPYGKQWRQSRRIVTTHLLSNKKVRSYRVAREEEVHKVMAKVHELSTKGMAVDMTELFSTFSNDLICRLAWNTRKLWDELLDEIIDERLRKQKCEHDRGNGDQDEKNFVNVLLLQERGITREHLKAILVDMFQAGTETSSVVLVFAMAELMKKLHLMAKLQAELRTNISKQGQELITERDLTNMTYLKAVIKETLRLHPPTPLLLPHLVVADCDIDGYMVRSGTRVIVNAWAIGRNCESWEAAEEFLPERFVDGGSAANVDFIGTNFQFLPFGAGRRICPGINFASASMEIILANLLYHFDWDVPAEVAVDKDGIDMAEAFGLSVQLEEKLLLLPVEYKDSMH